MFLGSKLYFSRFYPSPRIQSQPLFSRPDQWEELPWTSRLAYRCIQTAGRLLPCRKQPWVLQQIATRFSNTYLVCVLCDKWYLIILPQILHFWIRMSYLHIKYVSLGRNCWGTKPNLWRMQQMLIANGFLHFIFRRIVKISLSWSKKFASCSFSTSQEVSLDNITTSLDEQQE